MEVSEKGPIDYISNEQQKQLDRVMKLHGTLKPEALETTMKTNQFILNKLDTGIGTLIGAFGVVASTVTGAGAGALIGSIGGIPGVLIGGAAGAVVGLFIGAGGLIGGIILTNIIGNRILFQNAQLRETLSKGFPADHDTFEELYQNLELMSKFGVEKETLKKIIQSKTEYDLAKQNLDNANVEDKVKANTDFINMEKKLLREIKSIDEKARENTYEKKFEEQHPKDTYKKDWERDRKIFVDLEKVKYNGRFALVRNFYK